MGKQEALQNFAADLTERARKGEIDPVAGRDEEIRQIVDILMRRRQNNPILTGEAGRRQDRRGRGLRAAHRQRRRAAGAQGRELCTLDVGLLQAGASMKGEFENRLRAVIDEVQASPKPIILFIDEAHTLVGAGGAAGHRRRREPAEARARARHAAHHRGHHLGRVQEVHREGPRADPPLPGRAGARADEDKALLMLRGVASTLEKHHRVQLLDEAIEAAVKLSHRYIPARQLPDKAVSLLDTACARVAVSQHATPPDVEDSRRRIEALDTELGIIGREEAAGFEIGERRDERARPSSPRRRTRLAGLEARWAEERERSTASSSCAASSVTRPRPRTPAATREADGWPSSRDAASSKLRPQAAGRVAADPAQRRRAGRRLRRRRLDRHPGRPDGQERGRGRAQARRHAQRARHRASATAST